MAYATPFLAERGENITGRLQAQFGLGKQEIKGDFVIVPEKFQPAYQSQLEKALASHRDGEETVSTSVAELYDKAVESFGHKRAIQLAGDAALEALGPGDIDYFERLFAGSGTDGMVTINPSPLKVSPEGDNKATAASIYLSREVLEGDSATRNFVYGHELRRRFRTHPPTKERLQAAAEHLVLG